MIVSYVQFKLKIVRLLKYVGEIGLRISWPYMYSVQQKEIGWSRPLAVSKNHKNRCSYVQYSGTIQKILSIQYLFKI